MHLQVQIDMRDHNGNLDEKVKTVLGAGGQR